MIEGAARVGFAALTSREVSGQPWIDKRSVTGTIRFSMSAMKRCRPSAG
jgi:hypothetical protein